MPENMNFLVIFLPFLALVFVGVVGCMQESYLERHREGKPLYYQNDPHHNDLP